MRSLLIVTEQTGVETEPGTLPAVKVTVHVIPMKSPPVAKGPSVVRNVIYILRTPILLLVVGSLNSQYGQDITFLLTYSSIADFNSSNYLLNYVLSY